MTEQTINLSYDDKPTEECGVVGLYAPGTDVARLIYFALYALQHRGQQCQVHKAQPHRILRSAYHHRTG